MATTMPAALRAIVFQAFLTAITPLHVGALLLLFWIPRIPRYRIAAHWCRTNLAAVRAICGIGYREIGTGNIPQDGRPCIVMAKHSSTWEILALARHFPAISFVAKRELLLVPIFGWGFTLVSPIVIDRRAGASAMQQIIDQGRARLAQGFWIVIFPEGTRVRAGTRVPYKTGGARLAIELGVPILPVAHNAGWLWPKGVLGKRKGTVTISFGKPIHPAGKDPLALTAEVESWIEGEVERLGIPA